MACRLGCLVTAIALFVTPPLQCAATFTGFGALGCYKDNKNSRLMSYMTSFSGMYAQKCFDICQGEDPNYTHFGLQYGIECWCGYDTDERENFEESKLDESECNMECATPSQMCGGYSKMNVFEIKQFEGSNPRVGCFYDALPRAMSATPKYSSPGMTRAMCQDHCSDAGTMYYGLEYGTECWCGDQYDKHGEVVYSRSGDVINDSCEEEPCVGNTLEQCGGRWQLAVYRTDVPLEVSTPTPAPMDISTSTYTWWEELGCYQDNEIDPLMPLEISFSGMYRQKCFDICQGENPEYTHFGLKNYYQCWCGFDTDKRENFEDSKLDDSKCNEECATPSELCGGISEMRVFAMKQVEGVNPRVGCFNDALPRAMNATPKLASPGMTRTMCQKHCADAGTLFYGLEFGTECWCGDEYDKYGEILYTRSDNNRIIDSCEEGACSGNTLEQCGGSWRLAVYRTGVPLNHVVLDV